MLRTITEDFRTREEADAARERLLAAGMEQERIHMIEPAPRAGAFDHLARLLSAPPGSDPSDRYRLRVEVPASRHAQALLALRGSAPVGSASGQIFEFPEYREELRLRRQAVVKEEIVMRRQVEETVADVHGTVRRTEVEVEQIPPSEEALRFGLR